MSNLVKKSNRTKSSTLNSRNPAKKSKAGKKTSAKKGKSGVTIQYVLPVGLRGWVVKNSKLSAFTLLTDSKREAIHYARSIAQRRGEILEVHGRDMKVEERKKYRKPARNNILSND